MAAGLAADFHLQGDHAAVENTLQLSKRHKIIGMAVLFQPGKDVPKACECPGWRADGHDGSSVLDATYREVDVSASESSSRPR
jgi:hypothetical protein